MKSKFLTVFALIAGFFLTSCISTYASKMQGSSAKFLQTNSRLEAQGLFSDPYQCTGQQVFPRNVGSLFSTKEQPPSYVDIPANQLVTIFATGSASGCMAYASFYPIPNRRYAAKLHVDDIFYTSTAGTKAMCSVSIVDAATGKPVSYIPRKKSFLTSSCSDDLANRGKTR